MHILASKNTFEYTVGNISSIPLLWIQNITDHKYKILEVIRCYICVMLNNNIGKEWHRDRIFMFIW